MEYVMCMNMLSFNLSIVVISNRLSFIFKLSNDFQASLRNLDLKTCYILKVMYDYT